MTTDAELRALAERATGTRWRAARELHPVGNVWFDRNASHSHPVEATYGPGALGTAVAVAASKDDAAFIAAANPQAILALLDRAQAAEAKLATAIEALLRVVGPLTYSLRRLERAGNIARVALSAIGEKNEVIK